MYSSLFAQQVLSVSRHGWCGCGRLTLGGVELHQLGQVELRLLEDLDLANEHILEWEDLGTFFLDLLANLVSQQLLEDLLQSALCDFVNHNLHNLLADQFLL